MSTQKTKAQEIAGEEVQVGKLKYAEPTDSANAGEAAPDCNPAPGCGVGVVLPAQTGLPAASPLALGAGLVLLGALGSWVAMRRA